MPNEVGTITDRTPYIFRASGAESDEDIISTDPLNGYATVSWAYANEHIQLSINEAGHLEVTLGS